MFIGYFSAANSVTLFGLVSAVTACFLAANGNFKFAITMLLVSCLCDAFDGKIARSKRNRTPAEKFYGVQLDSLCDVISFGVAPCFISYAFGFNGALDVIIYGLFIVCGATRLAYFNTLSNEQPGKMMKTFRGMPIPVSTLVISILFLLTTFIAPGTSIWIFRIVLFVNAIAFIVNVKIKKPTMIQGAIFLGIQIIVILILLLAGDCQAPLEATIA